MRASGMLCMLDGGMEGPSLGLKAAAGADVWSWTCSRELMTALEHCDGRESGYAIIESCIADLCMEVRTYTYVRYMCCKVAAGVRMDVSINY